MGSVIIDRYTLGARLGEDDISEFHAARRTTLDVDQTFVLRILTTEAAQSRPTVNTFIDAARNFTKVRIAAIDICDYGTYKPELEGATARPYMVFVVTDDGRMLTALAARVAQK